MTNVDDIYDRVYNHFKANLEVNIISIVNSSLNYEFSVARSLLPLGHPLSALLGWTKNPAGFTFFI